MSYIPSRPKRSRPDFSLTIINIVFLLLLFYLATGSLIKQNELETDIPVTRDLPLERLPRPLLLISADRALFLDGAPVDIAKLTEAVRDAKGTGGRINILAERSMAGRDFLDLLALVDAAGVPIRIVTLHEDGVRGEGP